MEKGVEPTREEPKHKQPNVSTSQEDVEDQIMIESEIIEEESKPNNKDNFSMDPIFNEIIEPSLRITSGKRCKYFVTPLHYKFNKCNGMFYLPIYFLSPLIWQTWMISVI